MEVSVAANITLRLTATEFRLICLALDGKATSTPEDKSAMRDLSGKMLKARTEKLDALADASEHAESMHDRDSIEMEKSRG